MSKRWMVWGVLLVTSTTGALAVSLAPKQPVALARGGSGASCHCPCEIIGCNCQNHSESCHRCYAVTITLSRSLLSAILSSDEVPVLESSHVRWFEAAPHAEINLHLEGLQIRFVPDPRRSSRYVPDEKYDHHEFLAWTQRVDRTRDAVLSIGTKDDPATWRIKDGNPQHLNESLEKSFRLVRRDGSGLEVFRSDSTLGWESNLYLRSVVAGIPEEALVGDTAEARSALASLVDLVDLQVKAGDASGAVRSLDRLIEAGETTWLDRSHEATSGALCGFRKIRNLLVPGSSCS